MGLLTQDRPSSPEETIPAATLEPASLPAERLLAALATSRRGLTGEEAAGRLAKVGPNRIEEQRGRSLVGRLAEQFVHLFAILLWVGAGLALVAGMPNFAVAIVAVVVLNGLFGLFQELRAENAVAALKQLLPVEAGVLRGGEATRVVAEQLVPGDLLLLTEGDRISADARLLEATDLSVDESTLTGESRSVGKDVQPLAAAPPTLIGARDMVFAGSSVTTGEAVAVVTATGMRTEFGRLAGLMQSIKEGPSPLQQEVVRVARRVAVLSVVMGVGFFAIGHAVAHLSLQAGAVFAIGIVLGNVPEGLLPTLTLALAMGVRRMARRKAIVKKLSSVEALGSCTVICTDKTGTLTTNQMTVRRVWTTGHEVAVSGEGYRPVGVLAEDGLPLQPEIAGDLAEMLGIASLCSTARLRQGGDGGWTVAGDPTEGALLVAAVKAGVHLESLESSRPLERRFAFDAARKRTSAVRRDRDGSRLVAVKGAADQLLGVCTRVRTDHGVEPLSPAEEERALAMNETLAGRGLRVLGVAYRKLGDGGPTAGLTAAEVECDLTFFGLVAMEDPPRAEVPQAIASCMGAGIRVLMTTGDYGATAEAIAREIGLIGPDPALVVDGRRLAGMSEPELVDVLRRPNLIFSRLAPEQKLRIVTALQAVGETVAVTGDGVNDAPALKRADIGVAMGLSGTDVAREAADMILTDDNFATIVGAVEEGRAIFDNMRKFIVYIFAHLSPEAVPYVLFALFRVPLPLTVMQILAIDLGTETLPALALGSEKPEPDVMTRPPRRRTEPLLDWASLARGYGFLGLLTTTVVMGGFFLLLQQSGWRWGQAAAPSPLVAAQATTVVFLGIVLMQVGNAFACRTERASAFAVGLFSNRLLLAGVGFELVLTALLIYTPFVQPAFGTAALQAWWWPALAAFIPVVFGAEEGRKWLARRLLEKQA